MGAYCLSEEDILLAIDNLVEKEFVVYLRQSNSYLKLKESSGVDIEKTINDEIPFQILSQIQRGRFVNFNMDELSHEQKYILIRYNHACKEWSRSEYMTHSFLYHELRRVETYRDLEYAIHRLEAEIRRKDKRKG